ncbi:MAG: DNA gyrase inhibitor YacG [Planctomycetota bacterium]
MTRKRRRRATTDRACPTCGAELPGASTGDLPFCSERCRMADLDRWFTEDYRIPAPLTDLEPPGPEEA